MIPSFWQRFYPAIRAHKSKDFLRILILCTGFFFNATSYADFYCADNDNNAGTNLCGATPLAAVQAYQDIVPPQQNYSVATWNPKPVYGPIMVTTCTTPDATGRGNCLWTQTNYTGFGDPVQANGSRNYRRVAVCPAGTSLQRNSQCLPAPPYTYQEQKMFGAPQCGTEINNPCNAATGDKYQPENDYQGAILALTRSYNSYFGQTIGLGYGWISPFHKRGEINYVLQMRDGNGRGQPFTCGSSACTTDDDTHITLTRDSSGYTLRRRSGASERYTLQGRLVSETTSAGQTTAYAYDGSGRLSTITDAFGHRLTVTYNSSNHIASVKDPANNLISYTYDSIKNLTRVNYPNNTAKIYYYEDSRNPHGLTGIAYVESSGITTRFSTYGYYYNNSDVTDPSNGKAILTQHAQTDNGSPQVKFTLAYNSDIQTTVTDPVNMQEVMTFASNLGMKNLISKVNQADGKSLQQAFDARNNLTCRKDEEGRVTTYTYNATNQRLSMTEGLAGDCSNPPASTSATNVTRMTSYQYLSATLDLPTLVTTPSVASGQNKTTTIQYTDANHPNLPTVVTQSGYTPGGTPVSRTVNLGYNSAGQVTSIDGPRADASDVTTLNYYTCTAGGACGQLQSVTNARGHITTYDNYDANGRIIQATDSNGLRTNYIYDTRGQVLTVTQTPPTGATRTTNYIYNAAGDVTSVTFPDGRTLTYTYDAAHDLKTVADNLGNRIEYKYDQYRCPKKGVQTYSLKVAFRSENPAFLCPRTRAENKF